MIASVMAAVLFVEGSAIALVTGFLLNILMSNIDLKNFFKKE